MRDFTETTGAIARAAGVSQATVQMYSRLGLLPCIAASNGTRLYRPEAAQDVRRLLRERLANRGIAKKANRS